MKVFVRFVKVLAVVTCLAFFFFLTRDVIIRFQKRLTTTDVQFFDSDEACNVLALSCLIFYGMFLVLYH